MQVLLVDQQRNRRQPENLQDLSSALLDPQIELLWVDLAATDNQQSTAILQDIFRFHPLAIDDALNETHVPKLDDWEEYIFLVMRAVTVLGDDLHSPELDIFLGGRFLVTYHFEPLPAVQRVWQRALQDERLLPRGADYLMYQLIDEMASDCMAAVETLSVRLEELEAATLSSAKAETLEEILRLRRQILQLRRLTAPQRDVVSKLAREPFSVIDESERVFFRDVYDHYLRLYDLIENLRDLAGNAVEIYLSVVNNRMNDIMRTLTIITTLFMPLAFLTGFFGMNFFAPAEATPVWTGPLSFAIVLIVTMLTPLAMYWWMRRKGWIG